ncbi:EamA domain, WAT1-related protein [Tanacetum coccineum]
MTRSETWSWADDVLPFIVMIMLVCLDMSLLTIVKAAMNDGMNSIVYIVYHDVLGTFILLPFFLVHIFRHDGRPPLTIHLLFRFFILGILGSPTMASAISNLGPANTFLLAVIFRMEKIELKSSSSQAKLLGTIIAITGAMVFTFYQGPKLFQITDSSNTLLSSKPSNWVFGALILVICGILGSLWSVLHTKTARDYPDQQTIVFFFCLFGTIQSISISPFLEGNPSAWVMPPGIGMIAVLFGAVYSTIIRTTTITWCLEKKGPVYVAMFSPLSIVIAVIMGVTFLGDSLHLGSATGATIVAAGFYTVMWGQAKEKNKLPPVIEEDLEVSYDLGSSNPNTPLLLHLSSDERKCVLREVISTDHGLYMAVEETLKVFGQWLCGKCMDLHAVSRACHHPDGLVRFSKGFDDMSGYIVGISKPSNKEPGTEITEGLVLDAELLDRVFKVPITTVKCIPHGCRLAFSQALKIVLCKVVAQPDYVDAWVRLLLFPRCTLHVYTPKNRQEHRFGNRKSLQQSSILKSLVTWGKYGGIATLVKSILHGSVLGSFGQGGGDFLEEGAMGNSNIKQCLRKVANRHFTAAVKVLSSSDVAPYCDDTIKSLEAKHPYKPPPSMPSITFFEPPLVAKIDSVFCCIKSFPKGTSCGRDGLRAQHILDALCGEGSATVTDLLKVITSVVNLWLAGRCSLILADFVASAPLTPLFKPDKGIRPIAVGTI